MEENYKNISIRLNNAVNTHTEGPNYNRKFHPRIVCDTNIFTKGDYDILKKDLNLTYTKNQNAG